jgi:hypothetical protein
LVYEHPDYQGMRDKWEKYADCYEGSEMWQFIHRHMRESDQMFDNRVKRGYYYNYVASIVDLYIAYIFHAPITRQVDETLFEDLYKDADLQETEYVVFLQIAAAMAQVGGHVGILVDMPKAPEGGYLSEEERKEANARPYLTLVNNLQIKDWEVDRFNRFKWVKIQIDRPQEREWMTSVDTDVQYYLLWTREKWEEWKLVNEEATLLDSGENPLGEVPLIIMKNEKKPRHKWFGLSAVRDISDINIGILNWSSLGDEEIFERCLNVLAMEKDVSGTAANISHHNVLEYEAGAAPPFYLEPGASPLDLIGKWIDRAKDEIYRLAKLGGTVGLEKTREATSGIAYAFEFNETNQSLVRKAKGIQEAEVKIHSLYAKWMGEEFDGIITYPTEFGVEDFLLEFKMMSEARLTLTSETAIKKLEEKLTLKLFASDGGALRDKVIAEIKKGQAKPLPPQVPGGSPDQNGKPAMNGNNSGNNLQSREQKNGSRETADSANA